MLNLNEARLVAMCLRIAADEGLPFLDTAPEYQGNSPSKDEALNQINTLYDKLAKVFGLPVRTRRFHDWVTLVSVTANKHGLLPTSLAGWLETRGWDFNRPMNVSMVGQIDQDAADMASLLADIRKRERKLEKRS